MLDSIIQIKYLQSEQLSFYFTEIEIIKTNFR